MKKIYVLLFIIMIICVSGCGKQDVVDNNKKEEENTKLSSILKDYYSHEWDCEVPINSIKKFASHYSYFITNQGDLYRYSYHQLYSNETHCKKVVTDKKITNIIDNDLIVDDGNVYHLNFDDTLYKGGRSNNNFYNALKDQSNKDYSNILILYEDNKEVDVIVKDNKAYKVIWKDPYSQKLTFNGLEELFTLDEQESFVSGDKILQTTKNYYEYNIINKKECDKYADVECKYGLSRIDDVSDIYDDILYFDGYVMFLKNDKKIYISRYIIGG